ncbi:unnamed protein product [marine sediment metagenome]|uniref:Uncharacterized protein n=1 Tax=marine sediment metagenome TaxID=412755 RepID=X1JDP5_9ZZZZ
MAVSDVYSSCFDMQMPGGPASVNMHWQETTPPSSMDGPDALSGGLMAQIVPLMREVLSNECKFTQLTVYKKSGTKTAPGNATIAVGTGLSGGDALPAQFGAKLVLGQTFFDSKSNGMVWVPGLDEERVSVSLLDPAYLNGPIKDLADGLLLDIAEPAAGDGRFRLVVVSRKFLVANPGDWIGAAADVVGISRLPLVGRQKRRRSKVKGGAS